MQKIILFAMLVLIVLISGCGTDNTKVVSYNPTEEPEADEVEDTAYIFFNVDEELMYPAVVGEQYNYSFCRPDVTAPSDICGISPDQYTPSGGNPPYHFQLESGSGFVPMGMTLHPNGLLEGAPATAGIYDFTVCAVDQSGTQECGKTSLKVKDLKVAIDSITCVAAEESITGDWSGPEFLMTTKGTARGTSGDSLYYYLTRAPSDQYDVIPPGSTYFRACRNYDCGSWSEATWDYCSTDAACTNDKGIDTTSWTLVNEIVFDWRNGYEEGMPTSFDYQFNIKIKDNEIVNGETKYISAQVRCG